MIERLLETAPWMLVPLAAIISGAVIVIVWIISHYTYYARQAAVESRLKHDMLERGMSVDEIERVLWVSGENMPVSQTPPEPADPISENQLALIERLLDEERDLGEIERLMRSLRGSDSEAITTE